MILLYVLLTLLVITAALTLFVLLYRVSGEHFDSAGVPIHYTDQGSGVPIILVHGFAVNADINWRWPGCLRKLVRAGYRVIAMDARGHGRSGKPYDSEAYGLTMAQDVIRLMNHLGIEKAHVAGYSMGGFITMKLMAEHPERLLSGVVCAAGWGPLDDAKRELLLSIVTAMDERRSFDPLVHWLDRRKRAGRLQCALSTVVMGRTNDVRAIVNVFKNFEGLSIEEEALRRNVVPGIILVGTRDGIRELCDLKEIMPNLDVVHIAGGDHLSTIMHPQFMRSMLAFLDAHSNPDIAQGAARVNLVGAEQ